jgi:hypothetical protein
MKKALYSALMMVMVVVSLAACKKSDGGGSSDDSGGGTIATTPNQNCNIPGTSGCNPNLYQQYAPNFIPYQGTYTNGFCGCPAGYRPVMNMSWGISCAPSNYFPSSYYYSSTQVTFQIQNGQVSSMPQVTYAAAASGYVGNCYSAATSVCDVRSNSNPSNGGYPVSAQCPAVNGAPQGYCRGIGGGSYMGICSNGVGNESYSNRYNNGCYRRNGYGGWMNVCRGAYGSYYYNGYESDYYGTGDVYGGSGLLPR